MLDRDARERLAREIERSASEPARRAPLGGATSAPSERAGAIAALALALFLTWLALRVIGG